MHWVPFTQPVLDTLVSIFDLEEFPFDFWDGVALISSFSIVVGSPKVEADLKLENDPLKMFSSWELWFK